MLTVVSYLTIFYKVESDFAGNTLVRLKPLFHSELKFVYFGDKFDKR